MIVLSYPCVIKRKKDGALWQLERKSLIVDYEGVFAAPLKSAAGKVVGKAEGIVNWERNGDSPTGRIGGAAELLLHTISAQPRGCGLGAVLMFAFADHAVKYGIPNVNILLPNIEEHGFYLKMGCVYRPDLLAEFQQIQGANVPEERTSETGVKYTITAAQRSCPITGSSIHVKTTSAASFAKQWDVMMRNPVSLVN